jgi:1,4-dihydroxy-2-naphthoate octaprenyltransferase
MRDRETTATSARRRGLGRHRNTSGASPPQAPDAGRSATATAAVPGAGQQPLQNRLRAYAQLSKLYIFDQYFGIAIVWSLLPASMRFDSRTIVLLLVSLVSIMATVVAAVSLDDVKGFRDGSDLVNYTSSNLAGLRDIQRKPLLAGTLTEAQAIRFGLSLAVIALVVAFTGFASVGGHPWWLPLVGLAIFGTGVQYSYGIGFSYRYLGAEEVILTLGTAAIVFLPYPLITGGLPLFVFVQALLFGVWMLQVTVFSNTHDIVGDRPVGRSTVASRFSERGNDVFIVGVFSCGWVLLAVGVVTDSLPVLGFLALTPFLVVQAAQLRIGVARHDPLRARKLGLYGYRFATIVMIGTNLLLR